jgi:hypothetical protein
MDGNALGELYWLTNGKAGPSTPLACFAPVGMTKVQGVLIPDMGGDSAELRSAGQSRAAVPKWSVAVPLRLCPRRNRCAAL